MASLDFAFLAEFAKVESTTTITAVGAGIRGVEVVGEDHGSIQIYLAGGVDRDRGEGEAAITITVQSPAEEYTVSQTGMMQPAPSEGDFATTVFAVAVDVPFVGSGKYFVSVSINDELARTLDLWIRAMPLTGGPSAGA